MVTIVKNRVNISIVLSVLALSACKYSNDTQSIVGVDGITASNLYYGKNADIVITGHDLGQSEVVTADGCTTLVEKIDAASKSSNQRTFTCAIPAATSTDITSTLNINVMAKRIDGTVLMAQTFKAGYSSPVVSSLEVDFAANRYGSDATITVNGTDLSNAVSIDTCSKAAIYTSDTQRIYNCPILAQADITQLTFNAKTSDGTILKTTTLPLPPKPQVLISTDLGDITIELEPIKTPITVNNFLTYVNSGFYAKTVFHRISTNYHIVQGGGFASPYTGTAKTGTNAAIALESKTGISNVRGTIAMARTSAADSATSQFFFNSSDNSGLWDYKSSNADPNGYVAFGTITDATGLAVLDALQALPIKQSGSGVVTDGVPVTETSVKSMTQIK